MISCLTVTREGKLDELARAIRCFDYQTFADRELIILHDGGDPFDREVRNLAAQSPNARIQTKRAPTGLPLGALRNLSVELASHDVVCQWDDDDLYHPKRLEVQYEALRRDEADFCFFTDQLHFFESSGQLFWDDWMVEDYPMNLIQGTLLGYRQHLGRYGHLARGEDTPVVVDLVQRGCKVVQLRELGYLYIYVYNGKNVWGFDHHAAISEWKRFPKARLLKFESVLRSYLADYNLMGKTVVMPHEDGELEIRLSRR